MQSGENSNSTATSSGWIDILSDILKAKYGHAEAGTHMHAVLPREAIEEMKESYADWLRNAHRRCIYDMYVDRIGKQKSLTLSRERVKPWLDIMTRQCPLTVTIDMPTTPLHDISAEKHTGMICTEGMLIGVETQQAIVSRVRLSTIIDGITDDEGWMPYDLYNPKKCGPITDSEMTDVQYLYVEEPESRRTPRRMMILAHNPHVGKYEIGDLLRMYGKYDVIPSAKKIKDTYLDTVHIERLPPRAEAELSDTDLEAMRQLARTDPDTYITKLTASLAPDIIGNRAQKTMVILTALKGVIDGDSRNNLHLLLIDNPGSGKSALLKWVADILPKCTYVDGPNATAQGLLYGQSDMNGRRVLHAGPMIRNEMVVIDEADKMPSSERQKTFSSIEQQRASYHKMGFDLNTDMDLSMIAAANPYNEIWDEHATITDNASSVESAFLSRCIITRMEAVRDSARLVDQLTGNNTQKSDYTKEQVAGVINHCRRLQPEYTPEAIQSIKTHIDNFRAMIHVNVIDTRKEIDLVRIASATAKLLHRDTVDADSIRLGYETYTACLEAVGMSGPAAPRQTELRDNKQSKFMDMMRHASDEDGTIHHDKLVEETQSTFQCTEFQAKHLIQKMYDANHIMQPTPSYYKSAAD